MPKIAIDLDGTMIDSTAALVAAYREAGVEYVPNVPWREWCTPAQHDVKDLVYRGILRRLGRVLPLGRLAEEGSWPVLTGASDTSIATVREVLGLRLFNVTGGLTWEGKVEILLWHGYDLFFDDDERVITALRGTRCQAIWTR